MSNENKEQESIENDVNVDVDKSKRKFSKAGLAAPVIMTLASKPVWARDINCTYSGSMSGNMSQVDDQECAGEGLSPGYWSQHEENWYKAIPELNYVGINTFFKDVFYDSISIEAGGGPDRPEILNPTMLEAMLRSNNIISDDNNDIVSHICLGLDNNIGSLVFQTVAAFQNACSPLRYFMTAEEVITAYTGAVTSCNSDTIVTLKDLFDFNNNFGDPRGVFP